MADLPNWHITGDWFDVCKCNVACPCTFAQAPTYGDCDGLMAWHIRDGRYGDVTLDGLNVVSVNYFKGNAWAGEAKVTIGFFVDQRADANQREAIQEIFTGQAGGWMANFAGLFGEMRGFEYVPIEFEVADDLAYWRVEIPGKASARGDALEGPTTPPGTRVQLHNPPGSEVGPGQVATFGVAKKNEVDAFGFKWDWSGRSSKHFPFDWSGP
jgi:hypothetical protein